MPAGHQQQARPATADRVADRVQQGVGVASVVGLLDDHDRVRPFEGVAQCPGPGQCDVLGIVADQIGDDAAAEPEFGVGHTLQPGELHGQHGRAVLERDGLVLPSEPVRVDEQQHADHVLAGPRHREQPAVGTNGPSGAQGPLQDVLTSGGRGLRSGARRFGTRPGQQVAVPVLDGRRKPGELVQRASDALLAAAGAGDLGENLACTQAGADCSRSFSTAWTGPQDSDTVSWSGLNASAA